MKAVVKEKVLEPIKPKSKYPYLGTSTNNSGEVNVVLFTSRYTGTVVFTTNTRFWKIGDSAGCWAEDIAFTPFTGTIELSND
jgi:hypothetical protein